MKTSRVALIGGGMIVAGALGYLLGVNCPLARLVIGRDQEHLVLPPVASQRGVSTTEIAGPVGDDRVAEMINRVVTSGQWSMNKEWEVTINGMQSDQLQRALPLAEKITAVGTRNSLVVAFLSRWAECDPRRAVAYAQSRTNPSEQQRDLAAALHGWIYSNPTEASLWLRQLRPGTFKDELLLPLIPLLANNDPLGAYELTKNLRTPDRYGHLLNGIFQAWATNDPQAAADEVLKVSNANARSSAIAGIAAAWSLRDVEAALRWSDSLSVRERNAASAPSSPNGLNLIHRQPRATSTNSHPHPCANPR